MEPQVEVGLIVIDDLFRPYRFDRDKCVAPRLLSDTGRVPGALLPPTLDVPDVLVVATTRLDQLLRAAHWLRQARRIVLLHAPAEDEFRELEEHELEQVALELPRIETRLSWAGADDIESIEVALDVARQLVVEPPELEPASRPRVRAHPPGAWLDWTECLPFVEPAGQIAASLFFEGESPRLRSRTGVIDLATGWSGSALETDTWVAVSHDGTRWLERADRGWRWAPDGEPFEDAGGRPINGDPCGRVFWTGHRCRYDWWLGAAPTARSWAPSEHGWPVGHGKKLWGYQNNDPVRVELNLEADAAISHYEHDALITGGLPLRWQVWADLVVATRFASPPYALYYQHVPDQHPGDPADALDEDGRTSAPVVALGPGPGRRYAVGFEAETWRVIDAVAERLPAASGWALYDTDHRIVDSGTGRLLGGSAGALLFDEAGVLRRMGRDGSILELGEADRIDGAVPTTRSANLIAWRVVDERIHVRLV